MKNQDKNHDPERARKRAVADLRCAVRKLGIGESLRILLGSFNDADGSISQRDAYRYASVLIGRGTLRGVPDTLDEDGMAALKKIHCGHSACSQNYIDTGSRECVA